ncbi:MAG: DNA repair protein RecO [Chloroflexi bacterium]|nr:DNA repair protein RecO [Chloroflexota bacterium]
MTNTERTLRVDAVVLSHKEWGEADQLLVLFTREHGKMRAIAKGVRKMQSRKAGHLEPFSHTTLMLAKGHDSWIVTQAETIQAFVPLREDLQLMTYAAYVIELLDRFTYEEGQNWHLYQLVVETLTNLASLEDPYIVIRYYEMRILDLLGFRPMLFECVRCHREILAEDQFFSAQQGGVLCPSCGSRAESSRLVSMEALRYLRHFQRGDYLNAQKANPPLEDRNEIEGLMNHYLTFILERKLNAPEFLKKIQ